MANEMASVRVLVNLSVKQGTADDFKRAWAPAYDRVKAETGCVQFELFQSTRNPEHFAVLEQWASRADFDRHTQLHKDTPRVGAEYRESPRERKIGKSGLEIYWDLKTYQWDGENWVPAVP